MFTLIRSNFDKPGVNPVREDEALTPPFHEELKFYLYRPHYEWRGFLTG
jgi:hypothetical protein